MRFLCISCDTQMKLVKDRDAVTPDNGGSLSIRYECPECLYEIAMCTNPQETKMVSSMGVKIGGETVSRGNGHSQSTQAAHKSEADSAHSSPSNGESKCPFAAMVKGNPAYETSMLSPHKKEEVGGNGASYASTVPKGGEAELLKSALNSMAPDAQGQAMEKSSGDGQSAESQGPIWSEGARARLERIPSFVRPAAEQGIIKLAADQGVEQITEDFMDMARDHFGM